MDSIGIPEDEQVPRYRRAPVINGRLRLGSWTILYEDAKWEMAKKGRAPMPSKIFKEIIDKVRSTVRGRWGIRPAQKYDKNDKALKDFNIRGSPEWQEAMRAGRFFPPPSPNSGSLTDSRTWQGAFEQHLTDPLTVRAQIDEFWAERLQKLGADRCTQNLGPTLAINSGSIAGSFNSHGHNILPTAPINPAKITTEEKNTLIKSKTNGAEQASRIDGGR